MAELKTLVCPKCGAQVQLERGRERGTCSYCGTVAYVENPRRQEASIGARPTVRHTRPGARTALFVVGGAVSLALVGLVVGLLTSAPPAAPAPDVYKPIPSVFPKPPELVPMPSPSVAVFRVQGYVAARLVDSDGDKRDELVVPIEQTLDGKTTSHFGVFSTSDGKLRHQTPAIESAGGSLLTAVAFGRLVLAAPNGQLTGYDLASGDAQWSTALGERVAALCTADKKVLDSLQVVTDDGRNLLLDVKTGRQSPTKHACTMPLAVSMGRHAPSDRRDYRAPAGIEAWQCGGVRVMGSDNYSVPDACQQHAHLDTDKLDGMVGHAVWRIGKDFLVLGVRKPGTYVPTVGLLTRGHWAWKNEVPAENPLEAETGGPRLVTLLNDRLLIGYASGNPRGNWVTHFDLHDGTRRWSVGLSEASGSLVALVQDPTVMVVHAERQVALLSPETGALIATVGAAP